MKNDAEMKIMFHFDGEMETLLAATTSSQPPIFSYLEAKRDSKVDIQESFIG